MENSGYLEKVESFVQRENLEENRRILCKNLWLDQDTFPPHSGVNVGRQTRGAPLTLDRAAAEEQEMKKAGVVSLSPVSPLEMPGSPAQSPMKKTKTGFGAREAGCLRAVVI